MEVYPWGHWRKFQWLSMFWCRSWRMSLSRSPPVRHPNTKSWAPLKAGSELCEGWHILLCIALQARSPDKSDHNKNQNSKHEVIIGSEKSAKIRSAPCRFWDSLGRWRRRWCKFCCSSNQEQSADSWTRWVCHNSLSKRSIRYDGSHHQGRGNAIDWSPVKQLYFLTFAVKPVSQDFCMCIL